MRGGACLQSWTDQCNFSHDLGTLRASNYGENLAQVHKIQ